MPSHLPCPLCECPDTTHFHTDKHRTFFQCQQCKLVFVHPDYLPSPAREQQEYDLHENHFEDEGYRQFLSRAETPVREHVTAPAKGLDFGCGPSPVLASMLEAGGYSMHVYDPIYAPDKQVLTRQYDFITCTEAVEHFHHPAHELSLLFNLLKPGGVLVIMTKRVVDAEKFASWHYKNDITHVSFFADDTIRFLGTQFNLEITLYSKDVVLLKKHP